MEKVILSHIKKLEIFRRVYSLYEIYLLLFFRKNSEGLYLFENLCYQDGTESFGIFLNNLREDLWLHSPAIYVCFEETASTSKSYQENESKYMAFLID